VDGGRGSDAGAAGVSPTARATGKGFTDANNSLRDGQQRQVFFRSTSPAAVSMREAQYSSNRVVIIRVGFPHSSPTELHQLLLNLHRHKFEYSSCRLAIAMRLDNRRHLKPPSSPGGGPITLCTTATPDRLHHLELQVRENHPHRTTRMSKELSSLFSAASRCVFQRVSASGFLCFFRLFFINLGRLPLAPRQSTGAVRSRLPFTFPATLFPGLSRGPSWL
jgi:hypothetical protein